MAIGIRKYIQFRGALYCCATYQKLDVENNLLKEGDNLVLRELDSGLAFAESAASESKNLLKPVLAYVAYLEKLRAEIVACTQKERPHSNDISLLDADVRAKVTMLVKAMEKYNHSLNFTVDAAASNYDHIKDQVDALSFDHGAAATELTGPASDNKLKSRTPMVLDTPAALEES